VAESSEPRVVELVDSREQQDEAYRAIGRYMVVFSMLIASMRSLMIERLTEPETEAQDLIALAFGSSMAQQIADPFFAMCRAVTNLDESEAQIESLLRRHVNKEIEERNRMAHSDWLIARWTRGDIQVPTAARVLVKARSKEPVQQVNYKPEQIDGLGERAELLRNVVWEFGSICLQRGTWNPREGYPTVRVRDSLQIEAGRVVYKPGDHSVPFPPR
jgi:hypothetical protein